MKDKLLAKEGSRLSSGFARSFLRSEEYYSYIGILSSYIGIEVFHA